MLQNPLSPRNAAHIFTYGSLMFEPVWQRVVSGRYRSALASVSGFQRFSVLDQTYPAAVPREEANTSALMGRLYFDVDPADLQRLDAFEGLQYQRTSVQASLLDGGVVECQLYEFIDLTRLGQQPWDPKWFEEVGIHEFLRTYCIEKGV